MILKCGVRSAECGMTRRRWRGLRPIPHSALRKRPRWNAPPAFSGRNGLCRTRALLAAGFILTVLTWWNPSMIVSAEEGARLAGAKYSVGDELFTHGAVPRIEIEISPRDMESLRGNPREYVRAIVREGGKVFQDVGIHLKGSVGSFRGVDDKPGLTLNFEKFNQDQKFHGLRKIHLNNSVEDPAYCNEVIGSELFQAAGVPAPRVTRALVRLNHRQPALYVLKEGFTKDFLARYFVETNGNLYDTDWGHDVDQRMKRNSGREPGGGQAGLKALAAAALDPDAGRRWRRLEELLDTDRFLNFMALEVMICHRDGYCLARNNFRIYHDPRADKMIFLPHGMDQLFEPPDLPWQPFMAGIVAKAIMETPEGKQRYRECFHSVFTNVFRIGTLTNRVDELVRQLRPVLGRSEFKAVEQEAALVKERIARRQASLKSQLSRPEPARLNFTDGIARLTGWEAMDPPVGGTMKQTKSPDGLAALGIVAGPATSASWRTKALLGRGHYLFAGRARVSAVKPLPYGQHQGAGLRVAGGIRQSADLMGGTSWRELEAGFQVETETAEVEFICELRAGGGQVWFDLDSLRVLRIP